MYSAYDNPTSRNTEAYPAEPLNWVYGRDTGVGKRLHDIDLQRAYTVNGRPVRRLDCGPIRVISTFGHIVRELGRVIIERAAPPNRWRDFSDNHSTYGPVRVSGDRWHGTESGFVASWLAGSEYAKISTGIHAFLPKGHLLYQGLMLNPQLIGDDTAPAGLDVTAGLEYVTPDRMHAVGDPYPRHGVPERHRPRTTRRHRHRHPAWSTAWVIPSRGTGRPQHVEVLPVAAKAGPNDPA